MITKHRSSQTIQHEYTAALRDVFDVSLESGSRSIALRFPRFPRPSLISGSDSFSPFSFGAGISSFSGS